MKNDPANNQIDVDDGWLDLRHGPPLRINAMIDGVYAIIMTILVLDLKLPENLSQNDTTASFYALAPRILAFVLSFAIAASSWAYSHTIGPLYRRSNTTHVAINLTALMFASLIPFCASVLGSLPNSALGPEIYALVVSAQSVLYILDLLVCRKALIPQLVSRKLIFSIVVRNAIGGVSMALIGVVVAPQYPTLALWLIVIHFAAFWWMMYTFARPIHAAVKRAEKQLELAT